MIQKGDIVEGAFNLIRVNGLIVQATPNQTSNGVQVLDDYMAELSIDLDIPYLQPSEYGRSLPSDISGLTTKMVGPIKKLLVLQLLDYYGKVATPTLVDSARSGMKSLVNLLVQPIKAQLPSTLPTGSGNQNSTRSPTFYPETTTDDTEDNFFLSDSFILPIDWSDFVGSEVLTSVSYSSPEGVTLSNESFTDYASSVKLSFTTTGLKELCITATKGTIPVTSTRTFTCTVSQC